MRTRVGWSRCATLARGTGEPGQRHQAEKEYAREPEDVIGRHEQRLVTDDLIEQRDKFIDLQ